MLAMAVTGGRIEEHLHPPYARPGNLAAVLQGEFLKSLNDPTDEALFPATDFNSLRSRTN